jgi:hypothetical protein
VAYVLQEMLFCTSAVLSDIQQIVRSICRVEGRRGGPTDV